MTCGSLVETYMFPFMMCFGWFLLVIFFCSMKKIYIKSSVTVFMHI